MYFVLSCVPVYMLQMYTVQPVGSGSFAKCMCIGLVMHLLEFENSSVDIGYEYTTYTEKWNTNSHQTIKCIFLSNAPVAFIIAWKLNVKPLQVF